MKKRKVFALSGILLMVASLVSLLYVNASTLKEEVFTFSSRYGEKPVLL